MEITPGHDLKIGSDKANCDRTMGNEGCGIKNDNGERLLAFCTTYDLVIGGTLFQHKNICCLRPRLNLENFLASLESSGWENEFNKKTFIISLPFCNKLKTWGSKSIVTLFLLFNAACLIASASFNSMNFVLVNSPICKKWFLRITKGLRYNHIINIRRRKSRILGDVCKRIIISGNSS